MTMLDLSEPVDLSEPFDTPAPLRGVPVSATTLVARVGNGDTPAPAVRSLRGMSREDILNLSGAFVGSTCLTLLLFGRLTPLSGPFGFLVVIYVLFLVFYAFLVSLTEDAPAVVDKVMAAVLTSAAVLAFGALFSVIFYTLWSGRDALTRLNLFVNDMSSAGPAEPLSVGGIAHAMVGTFMVISVAMLLTVPLGLLCALFLNETRGRAAQVVRTVVDAMTALPSILAGLFIFATWILILGFERSSFAASLAVSIMMLPIIIRSADVVLRLVPQNLREASVATGAPMWRTVWHVVLPTARSGLVTSIILGLARGIGETAPVLLTSGFTATMNVNPVKGPMVSLPLAAFEFVRSPQPAMRQRGFATAAVLMVLVLVLFTIARLFGGRLPGQVSARQARRVASRSARDAARFDRIALERSATDGTATVGTATEASSSIGEGHARA